MKNKIDPAEWVFRQWVKESLKNPESTPGELSVLTLTPAKLAKVFTPARAELLQEIERDRCRSIGELAEKLGRPLESVSRDLKVLKFYGLIEIVKDGKARTPKTAKQLVLVPLCWQTPH
ncbi:helix-turn-helix domain-containing protein [Candidatus Micrarchaeota archaeon]|nr:helix-turn-helix domain-containing protein [Candidatus Micrarchaeota archaeon]